MTFNWTKRLIKGLLLLCFVLLLVLLILVILIHQTQPLQATTNKVDSTTAQLAKSALSRNIKYLNANQQDIQFRLSNAELISLKSIIERTNPKLSIHFNMTKQGVYIESTWQSWWQSYINLSMLLLPSTTDIKTAQVKIGHLTLPDGFLVSTVGFILKQVSGINPLAGINGIAMSPRYLVIDYAMLNNKKELLKSLTKLAKRFGSQHNIENNLALTTFYYRHLQRTQQHNHSCKQRPLSYFIYHLNQANPLDHGFDYSVVEQNRATIFALAVYFGSYRFEYFIGKLVSDIPRKPRCYSIPTLAGREDLTKHFIYSAAIELLSSTQTSEFIGELKELLDSNLNGSGFSFVDLLADRAGVKFAQLATRSEQSALRQQQLIANGLSPNQLFPPAASLPEGLSQQEFEQAYQHIDAAPYHALITQIDSLLHQLALYQQPHKISAKQ